MATEAATLYPNTFQTHNFYVDNLLYLLTGDEFKTLSFAVRQIVGWQKKTDRISLSQFCNGIPGHSHGTGLSTKTQRAVLQALVDFGILLRVGENDPSQNHGVEWGLQFDQDKIDLAALQARAEGRAATNVRRTAAVNKRGVLPSDGRGVLPSDGRGVLPSDGRGVLPSDGRGVLPSDDTHKTQVKTQDQNPSQGSPPPESTAGTGDPAVVLVDPCLPETEAERLLFRMLEATYATLPARGGKIGRNPPRRFGNVVQRDNYRATVAGLPLAEVKRRLDKTLGANIVELPKVIAYLEGMRKNGHSKPNRDRATNGTGRPAPIVERPVANPAEFVSIV